MDRREEELMRDILEELIDAAYRDMKTNQEGGGYWSPRTDAAIGAARALLHSLSPPSPGVGRAYEAPRDPKHEVRVRGIFRDAAEPRSLALALTERPTDDELRALHDFFSGRPMLAALSPLSPEEGWRALPPGRSKQDVANLVDLALADSQVTVDDDTWRYDYDIMVEKLRVNGLAIVAISPSVPADDGRR